MRLREAFDRHGCDKGWRHGYERFYEPILAPWQDRAVTLLEIGVWRGASIAAWLDFLPQATILAVDTFQRLRPQDIPVLSHPRVRWWRLDSTRQVPPGVEADLVIDDGCHRPVAQRQTFARYWPLVRPGGRYCVEDAPELHWPEAVVHDFRIGGKEDSVIVEMVR